MKSDGMKFLKVYMFKGDIDLVRTVAGDVGVSPWARKELLKAAGACEGRALFSGFERELLFSMERIRINLRELRYAGSDGASSKELFHLINEVEGLLDRTAAHLR